MLRHIAPVAIASSAALLGGCSTPDTSALAGAHITAEQYAQTFQAARETLRDYRFSLDRVDAPQGVLTTAPRSAPGLAKPWEANSGPGAATDDLFGYQQRIVQVAFITGPAPTHKLGSPVIPLTDPDRDLVADPRETTLLVRVAVQRIERPDRRVSIDTVRVERQAIDPALREQGMWPSYLVPEKDDSVFAADLLRAILARSAATPAVTAAATTATPNGPSPETPR